MQHTPDIDSNGAQLAERVSSLKKHKLVVTVAAQKSAEHDHL